MRKTYNSRIITADEAKELMPHGRRADLHIHTLFSPDVIKVKALLPSVLYEKAKSMNLDYFSFTDHDSIEAYKIVGWQREGLIPGVEITILDKERVGHTIHSNVYLGTDPIEGTRHFNELSKIAKDGNIENFLQYCRDYNLPHTYNHPLWFERKEIKAKKKPSLESIVSLMDEFPVIEYNTSLVRILNKLIAIIALEKKKGVVLGSDTHIGALWSYTLAEGDSFQDYWKNIEKGKAYLVPRRLNREAVRKDIKLWLSHFFDGERVKIDGKSEYPYINVKPLDELMKIFYNGSKTRVAKEVLKHICYVVSNFGFAGFYLNSQYKTLKELP